MQNDQDDKGNDSLGAPRSFDPTTDTSNVTAEHGERSILPFLLPISKVRVRHHPFYGLLLPGAGAQTLEQYIRKYWEALDVMTGENILLISPVLPTHVSPTYLKTWENRVLTEKELKILEDKLREGTLPGARDTAAALAYRMAERFGIHASDLPVLLVASDGDGRARTLVIGLPSDWNMQTFGQFFQEFSSACAECAILPKVDQRLDLLATKCAAIMKAHQLTDAASKSSRAAVSFIKSAFWGLFRQVLLAILEQILRMHLGMGNLGI